MPRLLRSPETILRSTGQAIYFVRFADGDKAVRAGRPPNGEADLRAWLTAHLPHVTPEPIGPSEFSGWVCGGFSGDLYLNWTANDVAAFAAAWEDDNGDSLDPRFQCYQYPVATYEYLLTEHGDPRERDM